jgi:hypothetical protein
MYLVMLEHHGHSVIVVNVSSKQLDHSLVLF